MTVCVVLRRAGPSWFQVWSSVGSLVPTCAWPSPAFTCFSAAAASLPGMGGLGLFCPLCWWGWLAGGAVAGASPDVCPPPASKSFLVGSMSEERHSPMSPLQLSPEESVKGSGAPWRVPHGVGVGVVTPRAAFHISQGQRGSNSMQRDRHSGFQVRSLFRHRSAVLVS